MRLARHSEVEDDDDDHGIDLLFITDAAFSERAKDPAVVASLRKAKFLVVMSWDANHPLNDVADVLLPSTIHAEKEGTFTNLQGTVQRIHQAYPPKGQAVSDLEVYLFITAAQGDQRFKNDPRYDLRYVREGFAPHDGDAADDSALLERICRAYVKAAERQRFEAGDGGGRSASPRSRAAPMLGWSRERQSRWRSSGR